MKRKSKKNYIFIIILLLLSIGFAYLSTTLSINGRGLFGKSTWKIYFDNIRVIEGEEYETLTPTTVDDTTTSISFEANLPKPGDTYKFFVDVVNAGDLDAMINIITKTDLNSDYASFNVTYYDNVEISGHDLLKANSNDTLLVELSYKTDIELDTLRSDKDPINITISLEYTQADKTAKEREEHPATLIPGKEFNAKMKSLSNGIDYTIDMFIERPFLSGSITRYDIGNNQTIVKYTEDGCVVNDEITNEERIESKSFCEPYIEKYIALQVTNKEDNKIRTIERVNTIDDNKKIDKNLVSSEDSSFPIYMWLENDKDIRVYSETPSNIYFNEDSSYMMYYLLKLSDFSFYAFDTSKVTNMESMFESCQTISHFDSSNINTSKVIKMENMFKYNFALISVDLSSFDTSNVKNMAEMFAECPSLERIDLNSFDMRNVETLEMMLYDCVEIEEIECDKWELKNAKSLELIFGCCLKLKSIDTSKWNAHKLENISGMFAACNELENVDLSGLDTKNVVSMKWLFSNCYILSSIDLSNFDISSVSDMTEMFIDCTSLVTIYVSNNFDISNVTSSSKMFKNCNLLVGAVPYSSSNTNDATMANYINGYFTLKV